MGRKRSWTRERLLFCLASLNFFFLLSCASLSKIVAPSPEPPLEKAPPREVVSRADKSIEKANQFFKQGKYEAALQESEKAFSLAGKNSPGDKALFHMGLIYAHGSNPKKDYEKSMHYFRMILREYPQSPLVEEARVFINLLQENKKLNEKIKKLPPDQKRLDSGKESGGDKLERANELFKRGDYEGSIKENQRVLALPGEKIARDRALYNMALIYAHGENPRKDYGKSIFYFNKILAEYPESPLAPEAKVWIKMLQENQQLQEMIKKVKEVDIAVEEKKREKAK